LKPKTLVGYRRLLDVVVLPKWGDVKLKDVDHDAIQAWVWWLATDPAARQRPLKRSEDDESPVGLSAARVIQSFQVVDQVLAYAVRKHYIAANPAEGVEQPRKSSREDVALSEAGDPRDGVRIGLRRAGRLLLTGLQRHDRDRPRRLLLVSGVTIAVVLVDDLP
jgi:hypothetical protein